MTAPNIPALDALIAAVEAGEPVLAPLPDWWHPDNWRHMVNAHYGSLDAALALHNALLPGWWWQIGSCCVSDDAKVCPDFNNPVNGAALEKQFHPSIDWASMFDIDQRPPGNPARAWLLATIKAYRAQVAG